VLDESVVEAGDAGVEREGAVFLAPFGPSKPSTIPSGMVNVTSSTATSPPRYVLLNPDSSIAAGADADRGTLPAPCSIASAS
jgi:hypothetical protein